ncbi:hypothetical protein L484_004181 [Morus notabilis]|uniref:Uncharacterized protein n=1 Tax=Morus notabilis TaxID=981085 RepID=W9QTD2_9ROSA|nr:hypothetical protein L484_004181 [Morus notabilis]
MQSSISSPPSIYAKTPHSDPRDLYWKSPPNGWVKVNVDISMREHHTMAALITRDHNSSLLVTSTMKTLSKSMENCLWALKHIKADCDELFNCFEAADLAWINIRCNFAVHNLAKWARIGLVSGDIPFNLIPSERGSPAPFTGLSLRSPVDLSVSGSELVWFLLRPIDLSVAGLPSPPPTARLSSSDQAKEAQKKIENLKKEGKPMPKSLSEDGQYLRPSDPAYEQVLDSLAMVARHTPLPLLEALLKWRERWVVLCSPSFEDAFLISAIL